MARNQPFVLFSGGNLLNLAQHDDILVAPLKIISFFTGEDQTTPIEHIKYVENLCLVHDITQKNVAIRLLASSFKDKALQWFRILAVNLITTCDQLREALCKHFEYKFDHLSLVEQFTTIKRAPHEHMKKINFHFQRSWDKILQNIRPSNEYTFRCFLRSLNSEISIMI